MLGRSYFSFVLCLINLFPIEDKIRLGLVASSAEPTIVLTEESAQVKEFMESELVAQLKEDQELFHYFFKETESKEGWTLHVD